MNIEDIPQWAKEEACRRANERVDVPNAWTAKDIEPAGCLGPVAPLAELALMIAKHEQPPVDPVEEAARELWEEWYSSPCALRDHLAKAIRRGMEIERERGK